LIGRAERRFTNDVVGLRYGVVAREKDDYQPAAVLAAERLLRERDVSTNDEEEADRYFRKKEEKREAAIARVDSYKAAVADWVEPLARPSAELQPHKWYRIFLVVYGFWCARDLYFIVRGLIRTRSIFIEQLIGYAVTLGLDALMFVLILKKRRWGWILLVVGNTAMIFINLIVFVQMYKMLKMDAGILHIRWYRVNTMPNLYGAIFRLAVVAFFWRRSMAEFFDVEPVVKKWALGAGIVIGAGTALFTWYAY
jgi:hypothetical protein